ncbi:Ppx/GppA family phosphatase [Parvularcula maris]|uniref:Ppx/GppA family phosphatase n=1 Tax=Parvularcula maris TaxID=2965077 RepID=A0A9X2L8U2_9PROT|nr:Ppx/GppA family phosphatase [Parvularcula maris]MCQ8185239.1 Ppx/GppA family phosphatase [Parvularcula maris]
MVEYPRRAVVDIGSNSVRLVIFSGPPRVPIAITNEKALCGLGDRDPKTGELREEAMERALATLRRFRAVIESEEPETQDVFATAAVRDAPNGKRFLQEIKEIGFNPRLIAGEEEARLAGLGILCSAPEIKRERMPAIGGDLGGGSLELSLLGGPGEEVDHMASLPIGSLKMQTDFGDDLKAGYKAVQEHFATLPWIAESRTPQIYVVGGSWRAIARVAMARSEYPVPMLDHFTMETEHALEVCGFVEESDAEDLGEISGVQKKRAPVLPMAAMVLRTLIETAHPERVVVSSCGVREGLLFDRLPARLRAQEPIIAMAEDLAERLAGGRRPDGRAVSNLVDPLFFDGPTLQRLRFAAALMIRSGNMVHPDRRAEHAAATIMATPFLGIDHKERAMLALMMKARFNGSIGKSDGTIPLEILDEEQITYSVRVGYAHRLAAALRTPLYNRKSGFALSRDADVIELSVEDHVRDLVVETGLKDLERMASSFDAEAKIVTASSA